MWWLEIIRIIFEHVDTLKKETYIIQFKNIVSMEKFGVVKIEIGMIYNSN